MSGASVSLIFAINPCLNFVWVSDKIKCQQWNFAAPKMNFKQALNTECKTNLHKV